MTDRQQVTVTLRELLIALALIGAVLLVTRVLLTR